MLSMQICDYLRTSNLFLVQVFIENLLANLTITFTMIFVTSFSLTPILIILQCMAMYSVSQTEGHSKKSLNQTVNENNYSYISDNMEDHTIVRTAMFR